MSCHRASKVLNIAYNNAKVIYRIYKNERRIRQTPKQQKRHAKFIRAELLRKQEAERIARIEALMDSEASEDDKAGGGGKRRAHRHEEGRRRGEKRRRREEARYFCCFYLDFFPCFC